MEVGEGEGRERKEREERGKSEKREGKREREREERGGERGEREGLGREVYFIHFWGKAYRRIVWAIGESSQCNSKWCLSKGSQKNQRFQGISYGSLQAAIVVQCTPNQQTRRVEERGA